MNRRASFIAAAGYAIVDFAVIVGPAVVLATAARKGGLPGIHGVDLLVASAVVGGIHAGVAFARLTDEARAAARGVDVWIAAVDALVVLGLVGSLLLVAVLGGFAEHHAVLVNRGWPVVLLWTGVQLVAVVLAEAAGRFVFRWLEPDRAGT